MTKIRFATSLALMAALALSATSVSAGTMGEQAGRVNNQPTTATAEELLLGRNARLHRSSDGLGIDVKLITPEAGAYNYPEMIPTERQAQPEVFTGWVFVFNYPENCVSFPGETFPCGPQDFNEEVKAGVYNVSGITNSLSQTMGGDMQVNAASDGYAVISGDIGVGTEQRSDLPPSPDAVTFPLENPMGAEVHVAIAPHGQFDAATIAEELYNPAGNPACECWWVATFAAPAG
ncbi:MAG: hypothetical protein ACC726_02560 [Chloroflexota bacterium]